MPRLLVALALLASQASASYDHIANYQPETNVVPHSMIDLDMAEVSSQCGNGDFAEALRIYDEGGGGLCTATDIAAAVDGDPCQGATTSSSKGNSVKGSGAIRTIKGFATSGAAKMASEKWWPIYKNYWGDDNYADTFVRSAAEDTSMSDAMRGELIKKGAAYQGVWMYVLHEYEDAIGDCLAGNIFENDASSVAGDSPHAWDEGWAFYAGSAEGTDGGIERGHLLYQLAEKRCADFGTCEFGTEGNAHVNIDSAEHANAGRDKILVGDCYTVSQEFDALVDLQTVPLIQGTLKYAFKADAANPQGSCPTGSCDKEWAEGWAFAAAVLPRLHYCDTSVAAMVRENLDVNQASADKMKDGFAHVKMHIESTYDCLGITCAQVGAFQNSAGIYGGMAACEDPTPAGPEVVEVIVDGKDKKSTSTDVVPIIIVAVVAGVLLIAALGLCMKWRAAEDKLAGAGGNPMRKDMM
jgi:hypothetical protein